ncbi:MAG: class I SAM-dependent methyltransferase [Gemmatimonadota bacterium]|nr:class I SAM-dependent methyltransferase [Gemmatimonadota bacterium]
MKGDVASGLTCSICSRTFPTVNGLLNFLAYEESLKDLTYDLPHHPVASVGPKNRFLTTLRRLPIYHRLLLTSDYFSFTLERYLYKAIKRRKAVLDVGCREGTNLLYCGRLNEVCIGIDIDYKSAYYAQQMSSLNAFGLLASGTRLPFADASFDLVICCDVIEHVEEYPLLVKELGRVTQRKGELVLSTPDGDVRPKPAPYHVKHFQHAELEALLKPEFQHLNVRSIVRNSATHQRFWKFQDRFPDQHFVSILLNLWSNLRYYISGYAREDSFHRKDVTDSTFFVRAFKG